MSTDKPDDTTHVGEVVSTDRPLPTADSRVVVLPSNMTAVAGGRAIMTRGRQMGRPGRASQEDIDYHASVAQERENFIAADPVMRSSQGGDSLEIMSAIKQEVAREIATLAYQRTVMERAGRDPTPISSRRIDALKKIADIELEMRKIGFDQINVHSEKFQRIMSLWVETIRMVAEETLSAETADVFFNRLTTEMEGWEEKVEAAIR